MKPFAWIQPATLPAALDALGRGGVAKAGGMDLLDLMKEGIAAPDRIVSLRDVAELRGIGEANNGGLRIGAGATLAEVGSHPLVRSRYRALAQAVAASASPEIRNAATLGGNVLQRPRCWYFRSSHHHCARKGGRECLAFAGENAYHAIFGQNGCAIVHPSTPATALVAYRAEVELVRTGTRRKVPLESFFVPPERDVTRETDLQAGEILVAVHLPPAHGARAAHLRATETQSFDWSIADVAVVLEITGERECARASIVLGSAAPTPHRARAAERALSGKRIDGAASAAAASAAVADARPLSGNGYKVPIFETLVRRAIDQAVDEPA